MSHRRARLTLALACGWLAGPLAPAQEPSRGLLLAEAVRETLARQPRIGLQQQALADASGGLRLAGGQFDPQLGASLGRFREELPNSSADRTAFGLDSLVSDATSYRLSLQKQFRGGLAVVPSVQYDRLERSLDPIVAGRTRLGLDVTQPLLRGRGAEAVAATERFFEREVFAATRDLRQVESESALQTILAYWSYLAAGERLRILRDSELRSQGLVAQTRALVEADHRPAADMKQVEANLASREAARLSAEQALFQSRQELGLAMGLSAAELSRVPRAGTPFPEVPSAPPQLPDEEVLAREAMSRRPDYASAGLREEQARGLVVAAENAVKPQLDLVLGASLSGIDEGRSVSGLFSPAWRNLAGPAASISLQYSWPVSNNAARGQLARSQAGRSQAELRTADLVRTIRASVAVAREDLLRSAERLLSAIRASQLFGSAVEDERTKQQLGTATVIDLIVTEDRLTGSLLDSVSAEQGYASALARLRYETGTLLEFGAEGPRLAPKALDSIPFAGVESPPRGAEGATSPEDRP